MRVGIFVEDSDYEAKRPMDLNEITASAESDLREAVLAEFLKPELPAPLTLLRHAERYLLRLFDAHAQLRLSDNPDPDEFSEYLRNMTTGLPRMFFGGLGFPWNTCIEYAMIGVVDHGPEPRPSEKEIMARYIDTQGQLFLTYALVARADYWRGAADRKWPMQDTGERAEAIQAGDTEGTEALPSPKEAVLTVNAEVSTSRGRRRGPPRDYSNAVRVGQVVDCIAPDGNWRELLDDVLIALDEAQIPFPKTWQRNHEYRSWYGAIAADTAGRGRHLAIEAIRHRLKRAAEKLSETIP
jgi:hypothetical protein